MLRQIKNIRNIGIVFGFPTLIVIGMFLYGQQIEILNKESNLLKVQIDTLTQNHKTNVEVIVHIHELKVAGLQQEISQLQLIKYSAALSEIEAQEKLFEKEKTKLRAGYIVDKESLLTKINNLEEQILLYKERQLLLRGDKILMGPLIWDKGPAIVALSWGKKPKNLELNTYIGGEHINTMNKIGHGVSLDRDDADGFGPEVVSLEDRIQGKSYLFAVTNSDGFIDESSQASVTLAFDNQIKFSQEISKSKSKSKSKLGKTWLVFSVDDHGVVTSINKIIN